MATDGFIVHQFLNHAGKVQLASSKALETKGSNLKSGAFGLLLVLKTDVGDCVEQCAAVWLLSSQPKQPLHRAVTSIPSMRRDRAKKKSQR